MIGAKQLTFDANQIIGGMASSDYAPDGGLGSSTSNVNPFITPGIIYGTAGIADHSPSVAGNMIASAPDEVGTTTTPFKRLFIDTSRNFYTWDGSTMNLQQTGSSGSYTRTRTDMVGYGTSSVRYTYTSFAVGVAQWKTYSSTSFKEDWWTDTVINGGVAQAALADLPHPMISYNFFWWIANGNTLINMDTSFNVVSPALTINYNEIIIAIGLDPATGLMMFSTTTAFNLADTASARNFIYLFDGASPRGVRRIIPVDDLVTGFHNVGGTVYVSYGNRIGFWNGNGITYLRTLKNATYAINDLAYKPHMTHIGKVLYVTDGKQVLAYGEVVGGKKGWYYVTSDSSVSSNNLDVIADLGENNLGMCFATTKFYTVDMSSSTIGSGSGTVYFNNVNMPRPIFVRRMRVITTGLYSVAGCGGIGIIDETGTVNQPTIHSFVTPAAPVQNTMVFDFDYSSLKIMTVQPFVTFDTKNYGLVRVIIYYDPAE